MLTVVTPASTHDLTVLATVKAELGISGTGEDDRLADYIRQASEILAGWCCVPTFARETVAQTVRDLSKAPCIILARDFEAAISSIVADGVTLAATDYELDGALVYRLTDDLRVSWTARKVVITYAAGFQLIGSLPYAIERAAIDLVVGLYRGAGRDQSIRSEQTEGVGETQYFDGRRRDVPPLAPDRLAALERYRRPEIG